MLPSAYGPMLRLARDREGDGSPADAERGQPCASTEELGAERKARTVAEHERLLERHARVLAGEEQRALAEQQGCGKTLAERKQTLAEEKLREALAEIERLRADSRTGHGPR